MDKIVPLLPISEISEVPEYLITSEITYISEDALEEIKQVLGLHMLQIGNSANPTISKISRMLVSVNPETLQPQKELHIKKGLKLHDLIFLSFWSFWTEETFGWFLRCALLEKANYLNVIDKARLNFALSNQANALLALCYKFRSKQSILGYLKSGGVETIKHVVARTPNDRGPKRTGRIRGYRDHGTLRPSHQWIERNPANLIHCQIHVLDNQISTLFEVEFSRGYFVPQSLLEDLLRERRELIDQLTTLSG